MSGPAETTTSTSDRPRWLVPVVALVAVALVAGVGAFLVLGGDDAATTTIALESATSQGADPFTDSVSLVEYDGAPEPVTEVASGTLDGLDRDGTTGTLAAPGGTAGLYGGSTSESTCDVTALEGFLTDPDNAAKARAWAEVLGIGVDDIPGHLAGLTPTVLTVDTRVTNHGFDGDSATPRQSVLQAGTAVLVDDLGVPRVRCSCGNPLTEPERVELGTADTTGTQWRGYSAARVVTPVPAGEPVGSFTLVDVADGTTFQRAPGSAPSGTWVAVAGEGTADGRRGGTEPGGSIHTSSDGEQWEQVLESDVSMNAVAHGDDRFVAVGGDDRAGTIVASDNGTTWSEPVAAEVPLVDVAFGDGTWVALAADRTYTSADGANWTESAPIQFEFAGVSAGAIAYGDGEFVVSTYSCGASGCSVTSPLTSADGTSWARSDLELSDTGIRSPSMAYDDGFGLVGYEFGDAPADAAMVDIPVQPAAAMVSTSGASVVPQAADAPFLRGVAASDGTWYAVGAPGGLFVEGPTGVYTSSDLAGWQRVGEVDARLQDVVVSTGGAATAEATPSTTTTTTAAPAADVEITEAGFRVGGQEYSTATTPASEARAALTTALGEPSRATPIGGGVCEPGQYVWGELEFVEFNESYWYFTLGSPNESGGSVADRVTTDTGLALGDPISSFRTDYPATQVIDTEYGDTAYWADGSGDGKGLLAFASDGSSISSLSGGTDDPSIIADC